MPTVTVERISGVHAKLNEAVIETTKRSRMPLREQNKLLGKGCAQACELLEDWLASDVWRGMHPLGGGPVEDFAQDQERIDRLLPTLNDVLERAKQAGMDVDPERVKQAREALRAAVELFRVAEAEVSKLKEEVCQLADQLRDRNVTGEKKARARARALKLLQAVIALLPGLVIAMAGVTPDNVDTT